MATTQFPRLSSNHEQIRPIYDVIVIGSGCGGAIAACRAARAGQGVCVLEKGKEWIPGEFPGSFTDLRKNVHVDRNGETLHGKTPDLFSVHSCNNVTILSGVGLGGNSLTTTNVSIEPERSVFEQSWWPSKFQGDVENMFTVDVNNVKKMLKPEKVPAVSQPVKSEIIEAVERGSEERESGTIEDQGKCSQNVPSWVNFVDGSNPVSIKQPSCNGCGTSTTGCNTGAKNTLNLNYLSDAKTYGAEIFTETEVISLHRDSYTGLWSILYKRHSADDAEECTVKSNYVFLAAGSLGTSKILFQSKEKGLTVSDRLGYNLYCHSELFGLSYGLDGSVNGLGLTGDNLMDGAENGTNPGPCTSTIVDVPFGTSSSGDGMMISNFTLPSSVRSIVPTIFNADSVKEGFSMVLSNDFNEATEGNEQHSIGNILTLHTINKTASKGRISFQKASVWTSERNIELNLEADENEVQNLEAKIKEISKKLGGSCAILPKELGIDGIFSTSPAGGCAMADSGKDGVTDHKGKLFIGNTSDTHSGLYVIDSSTLPCSIGCYPAFSRCMLAERCMRIFAMDNVEGAVRSEPLQISAKTLPAHSCKKTEPGLKLTERMVGEVKIDDAEKLTPCEFVLTVESCDVNKMMELDSQHTSKITGSVTCPGLSTNPLIVSEGVFKLMRDSNEQIEGKEMIYLMVLNSEEDEQYYFYGIKYIHLDFVGETGLHDTTTLYVTIYKGKDDSGQQVAKGELRMKFTDFAKQLTTIEITNASGVFQQWKLKLKFVKFFLKGLWDTYSRLSGGSLLDPNAPPRLKRKLNLGDTEPEVYKVVTEDKVELRLTRYEGGRKGPIMLVHGLGVASNLYLMDTVDQNFVEYLVEHNYDVWLFDWRTSILLPKAAYSQYSVDDTAMHDFPAAVDKILEVTSEKDIQIVVHCFGAIAAIASVLLGRLEGKIRCILTSQVSATPIGNVVNKFKSHGCFSSLTKAAGVKSLTAYVDKESPWSEKTLNHMTRNFAFATTRTNQHCNSEVCHRITFLYGLLFEHKNLNVASHDILHELFGVASTKILEHTALITRKERIIGFGGKDIYLPGYKKKHRLKDAQFRRKMDLLNIPIMFFNGELNQCWNPENLVLTYNMVKEANPYQDYQLYEAEGYGHLDTFMGKRSNVDIFPNLVKWLDTYADDHDIKDLKIRNLIAKALGIGGSRTIKDLLHVKPAKKIVNLLYPNDLDPELEIKFEHPEHDNGLNGDTDQNIAGHSSDHQDYTKLSDNTAQQQQQQQPKKQRQEHSAYNELRTADRAKMTWERKVETNSCFHQDPKYKNPEATKAEQVVVKVFNIDDDSVKRDIVTISGLHLGADWSKKIGPTLNSLLANLKEIATTYIHSIVLLGDVFELCNTPINATPPSKEELMASWMSEEMICSFTSTLREISAESNVMLYYVRGDHDHSMTKALARELFGENVCFVPGSLIYKLDIGNRLYTIRFEHGHSADLFSDYNLLTTNSTERPLAYFLSRVLYSSEDQGLVDTRELLNTCVEKILKGLPSYACGSTVMDILEMKLYSNQLCARLFDEAFERELTGDECIMMEENRWIRLKTIFKTNFIKEAVVKYGSSEAYKMLQSSITDLSHHVKHCYEDVVVMGHVRKSFIKKVQGKVGDSIYANTGSWTDLTCHSYVKITLPRTSENGSLEMIAVDNV